MTGSDFGKWLDAAGISVAEASAYFGVSEKTIYQWRSTQGVPDRKVEWVQAQMAAYEQRATQPPSLNRVILEITNEQFDSWNDAANEEGKLLKEWAIATLEEAAAEDDQTGSSAASNPLRSLPRVAEEPLPPGYPEKKEKGA